jgi:protein O-mannosyl-transferase
LFSLLALNSALHHTNKSHWYWLFLCFMSFFLALLSKENAIVFIVIIPLTIYFFRNATIKKQVMVSIPLLLALMLFIAIRNSVVEGFHGNYTGELMNNPYLYATQNEKYATLVYVLGRYLKLLFWPYPLTFDYYPNHIALTHWKDIRVLISLALYAFLIGYASRQLFKKHMLSFSILFYLIALLPVSNLFFNIGTFMNERFIYQASIGFSVAICWLIVYIINKIRKHKNNSIILFFIILIPLLFTYSVLSYSRSKAWKNDFTLFLTDVKTSANSAKSNCSAGGILYETAQKMQEGVEKEEYLSQAETYLNKATEIHPGYVDAWRLLGNTEFELNHDVRQTFFYYIKALKINPLDDITFDNLQFVFSTYDSVDQKIAMYEELLILNNHRPEIYYGIGHLYGKEKNDLPKAIGYLKNAVELKPGYKEALKDLGVAYGITGNLEDSKLYLKKAAAVDPHDPEVFINLGITALRMGNKNEAVSYFEEAQRLKTNTNSVK